MGRFDGKLPIATRRAALLAARDRRMCFGIARYVDGSGHVMIYAAQMRVERVRKVERQSVGMESRPQAVAPVRKYIPARPSLFAVVHGEDVPRRHWSSGQRVVADGVQIAAERQVVVRCVWTGGHDGRVRP